MERETKGLAYKKINAAYPAYAVVHDYRTHRHNDENTEY